jgi:TRAP-type C4-dicarboxylate transport system permease small subunit
VEQPLSLHSEAGRVGNLMSKFSIFLGSLREKLKRTIGYGFETTALLCLLGFFIALLIQIFTRYVIHHPLQWTEELGRLFYIGMVFLGAAVAVDEHFSFRLGIDFLKKHSFIGYTLLTLLGDLTALVVLYYLFVGSYDRVVNGWTKLLPASGLRQGYFYVPLLIGAALLIVYTLLGAGAMILGLAGKERNGGNSR